MTRDAEAARDLARTRDTLRGLLRQVRAGVPEGCVIRAADRGVALHE